MKRDVGAARRAQFIAPTSHQAADTQGAIHCAPTADGYCVTCSDEALPARALRVDLESGLALVEVKDTTEEIDVTLVDEVAPGDVLLVHGGVAIGRLSEASDK